MQFMRMLIEINFIKFYSSIKYLIVREFNKYITLFYN